ncbi:MAG TPA: tetratricopeptide repeat protein [Acidobacteriaceae bacterium]|nr:tetratricopeptide repeat protein [Acidobacteriaceae bacterium]
MKRVGEKRGWLAGAVALGLVLCMGGVRAQGQSDNPFPGDEKKPAQQQQQPAQQQQQPAQQPASKPGQSDNPFPGEDSNAPILPADNANAPTPAPREGDASGVPAKRGADPDGDPVRSPDPAGLQENDGFSSSRSGGPDLSGLENETDAAPGKSAKNRTREEIVAEDINVGGFYTEKKNWRAAQSRFASAFQLDKENPDAVWGLAEAERHLAMYKEAAEHYQLFLTYDPDGPHGKAARKGLEEVEAQLAGKK